MRIFWHARSQVTAFVLTALAMVACSGLLAAAATSGTVVGATVPSATSLSVSACAPGVSGRTDLGTVLPGSSVLTGSDCSVVFGSSNDTARLRMFQGDHAGSAMYRPATGSTDGGFSGDGIQTDVIAGINETPQGAAVQDDGKLVVAGQGGPTGTDMQISRFDTAGILDGTFGASGRKVVDVNGTDDALAVAVQPDQKIVVGGTSSGANFTLVRLLTDGNLDPSFGTAGKVTVNIAPGGGSIFGLAILEDGRIVAAGEAGNGTTSDIAAARFRADGSLDPTFGSAGTTTFEVVAGANNVGRGLAVQPDGRIVIVGWVEAAAAKDVVLARLTTAGALDSTFGGGDGHLAQNTLDTDDRAYEVAIQDDGKIVVSGTGGATNYMVARFLPVGGLDTGFATNGVLTVNVGANGSGVAETLMLLGDGRIFVGGYSGNGSNLDFSAIRLTTTGALDTSFDGDGKRLYPIGAGDDRAYDMVLGIDGSVFLVGPTSAGATNDLAVVKLAGTTMPNYGAGADWNTPSVGFFGVCPRQLVGAPGAGGWTADGDADCADGDTDPWRAVPAASGSAGSSVGITTAPGTATANLRFALRVPPAQSPGAYIAPVTFEVVAPS